MSLIFEAYLTQAADNADLDFSWDEWKIHEDYADSETGLEERLYALSDAANLALGIALAEWIVAGLKDHDEERLILDYVQSAWASFSKTYAPTYFETDDDDWRGSYRGLLNMTLIVLNDAIFCRDEDPDVADRTNQLLFYAQKLFSGLPLFNDWLQMSLQRLERSYPDQGTGDASTDLPMTPAVPREVFGEGFSADMDAETLIDAHLARLGSRNQFLDEAG